MGEEVASPVNGSGVLPVEYKVLLKPDPVEEKTKGGIIVPTEAKEKEERENVMATLIGVGGRAFQDPEWGDPTPRIGDRVRVSRYAGYSFRGSDGEAYQLCQDKDICGVVVEELPKELSHSDQPDNAGDGVYGHLRSV